MVKKFKGKLPESEKELLTLPGVGKYTAAAISVFACNRPVVLLETNVEQFLSISFLRIKVR